jgi:predicted transcriptional regulator of viral defense system
VPAVRAALRRLEARGEIADPYRGFHVIVPPEYRRLGCLPPEQFVPHLMDRLGERYYVALLSAAQIHGAAHHRPQRFQVMVARNRKPLECGEVRVEFVARRDLGQTPVVTLNTPRGTLRVASPAATALELVGYAHHCGGLDNVATVLAELAERLAPEELAAAARLCPVVWSQRLGYLLELAGHEALSAPVAAFVAEKAVFAAPLVRSRSIKGAVRADRWKLAVNASVEAEA